MSNDLNSFTFSIPLTPNSPPYVGISLETMGKITKLIKAAEAWQEEVLHRTTWKKYGEAEQALHEAIASIREDSE